MAAYTADCSSATEPTASCTKLTIAKNPEKQTCTYGDSRPDAPDPRCCPSDEMVVQAGSVARNRQIVVQAGSVARNRRIVVQAGSVARNSLRS